MEKFFVRVAAAGVLVILLGSLVFGQATRTWVSGVGDDANPCSRTAPCKTFAGAISKTAAGGEIDVLDPGGFGAVTITKAISIEANGLIAGVLVSGTNGIVVAAGASDVVVLRGLTFEGLGSGLNGISFISGASLYVEHCFINNFTQAGISIAPSTGAINVFISDTTVRNNTIDGVQIAPTSTATVTGTLDQVNTEKNGNAGLDANGTGASSPQAVQLSFANSTSASNTTGLLANGANATIFYHESTIFGNATNLSPVAGGQITPD
jgi:hypothetical protein